MPEKIEQARSSASCFYKTDLHLHSPLSHDWKNDARNGYSLNQLLNRISSPNDITEGTVAAYYDALKKSGLQVVAITDHMKWSFGVRLAEYALQQEEQVLILPGIEINVKFTQPILSDYRLHIIAIFPPDIGRTKIDNIFPGNFPDEYNRNGQKDEVEYDGVEQLVTKIHGLNGYAIAAHIYNQNGFRFAYTNEAKLILKSIDSQDERDELYRKIGDQVKGELYKFDCLQVTETTNPIHFQGTDGEIAIPLVCCSDSHHIFQLGDLEKITYLKMGKLDFSSFREAFKYPSTRIRFHGNLPETKPPRIRGIRIFGSRNDDKSFFKDLVVGFSDNLTCLVGPRGSGKSAIIDAIRYVMGYNRTLREVESVKKQVIDRQKNTLHASRIEILYEKIDTQVHKLSATYDEREEYTTQVFDRENSVLNIPDVEASGDYPLNLYGWNELELLGEDPKSQRDNLDRFIPALPRLKSERAELYSNLSENADVCDRQIAVLEKIIETSQQKASFLRLKEFEAEFNKLNTPEVESIFRQLDSINQRLVFTARLKNEINEALEDLGKFTRVPIESILAKQDDEKEWCRDLVEKRLDMKGYNDLAIKYRAELEGKLKGYLAIIKQTEISLKGELNDITKSIKETVGEEESISADLRNNAKKRLDAARTEFEYYKQELARFEKMLAERNGIIEQLQYINERIYATRNREIASILKKIQVVKDDNFQVDLRLEQEKDCTEFCQTLQVKSPVNLDYDGLKYKSKKFPEILSDRLTPFGLAAAVFQSNDDLIQHDIKFPEGDGFKRYSIDEETAKRIIKANTPVENIEELNTVRYNREKMRVLFNIQQTKFDDEFYIILNERPIQYCSPGQRCSAMLPIVTLTSDTPMIIDQPEDNLDNRLVSSAVFKILSKLKETRQIILATHNPNILVSGDSEQVVVLKSNGTIENQASIDEPAIVENIIELMEGGREAFERRQKKYSIREGHEKRAP